MDRKPLSVSVNIVTRNRQEMLKAALESVFSQTVKPLEVIVIDNASTDQSVHMVRTKYPQVRLIQLHRNVGCQPGRNIGMANCSGDIIFNMDDDGTLAFDAIERVCQTFLEHPEVGLVAASVKVPHEKRGGYANYNNDRNKRYQGAFIGAAHALRKEILALAGYFPEYVRGHAEADLGLRIINSGWEILYDPSVIMYHCISIIERDDSLHAYYHIWHQLETSIRLQPAFTAWCQVFWRLASGLFVSIGKRRLWSYVKGIGRFLVELPRIISERKPISKIASKKYQYLSHHHVLHLEHLPDFRKITIFKAMTWRQKIKMKDWNKSAKN